MYIDTSVAVKLYTREPDSDECESLVADAGIVSSELLVGELASALFAKERAGQIATVQRERVWSLFEEHAADGTIWLVALNGHLVRAAVEVMAEVNPHVPLRTLDALHLATFLGIEAGPLFTRDRRMLDAARRLNLPLAAN
jgi:predicted nucleic acid-binding protein